MYGKDDCDLERTAFRRAEKKYKLYYDYDYDYDDKSCSRKNKNKNKNKKKNKNKNKQEQESVRAVDLSQVVDFKSILETFNLSGQAPPGFDVMDSENFGGVIRIEHRPGFYFIPGALMPDEQCRWIRESLTSFPQPPNRTNHNALYGPIPHLFTAAQRGKALVQDPLSQAWAFSDHTPNLSFKGSGGTSILASALLRKLRWATLGLQFDWSQRNYNVDLPHNKIPDDLGQLAKRLAVPAMPLGDHFTPEAAIVNYFASGDTLGGHLDDMELDWSKPIVSISLGCKGIFLLGGQSRQDEPLPMFLRSGDVVLMAGEARECFHGVPRIFTDEQHSEITDLEKHMSADADQYFLDYIKTSRININIRQVF